MRAQEFGLGNQSFESASPVIARPAQLQLAKVTRLNTKAASCISLIFTTLNVHSRLPCVRIYIPSRCSWTDRRRTLWNPWKLPWNWGEKSSDTWYDFYDALSLHKISIIEVESLHTTPLCEPNRIWPQDVHWLWNRCSGNSLYQLSFTRCCCRYLSF